MTILTPKRGSFSHNVLLMFAGTFAGQLASVVLAPLLTRIYSPEAFGVLGAFTALASILSVIAALRYEMALPLAKTPEDAINLLAVCGLMLAATTSLCFLTIYFLPERVFGEFKDYRFLLPVGLFCIGAYQVLVYYATQKGDFGTISRTKIFQGLCGPTSQIGLGLLLHSAWGLIVGFIIGQSAGVTLLYRRLVPSLSSPITGLNWKSMCTLARRYIRFPLISCWSGLIEAAGGTYLLLVLMPIMFSSTIAGFVFLTDRIIGRPLLLLSTSLLQVYLGDAGKNIGTDHRALKKRFLQLAGFQFVMVSAWLLLVNILAPHWFGIVFGEQWSAAVPYLQVLSICYLPQMTMHALIHTLQLLEKQALSAIWEIGRLIAVVAVFVAAHLFGYTALHTLFFYSLCQAASQIILFIITYHSINNLNNIKN